MELIVRVPGSCGEVMQGFWQGRPFLVTCPIDRYSTVVVLPGTGRLVGGRGQGTPCPGAGTGLLPVRQPGS